MTYLTALFDSEQVDIDCFVCWLTPAVRWAVAHTKGHLR